jgi:hypothetical protein
MLTRIKKFIKSLQLRLKIERAIVVSVIVTQSLKRVLNHEVVEIVMEFAPFNWVNVISSLQRHIVRANGILMMVLRDMTGEQTIMTQDLVPNLSKRMKWLSDEEKGEMYRSISTKIASKLLKDEVEEDVDEKMLAKISDETYHTLFKK